VTKYAIRRLIQAVPVLIGITVLSFTMIHIAPGTPIGLTLDPKVSPAVIEQMRKQFHLDEPFYVQYWFWLRDMMTGELKSFKDGRPVFRKILERLPATILLNLVATIIGFSIAIPLGVYSATHRYSKADHATTVLAFIGISMPSFWLAYLLILLLVQGFGLPVLGARTFGLQELSIGATFADRLWHLFVPSLVIAFGSVAALSRYMRGSMLEVVRQDYITTARAKGLDEEDVNYRHALRNALMPLVTIFGFLIPDLIGGSVIIETVFAYPGIGRLGFQSVFSRDYPTVMTLLAIAAVLTLIGNLVADLLYAVVDPRVRYD
jgi:peptide/nickel transport system permease protein